MLEMIHTKNIEDLTEVPVVMRQGIELEKGVSLTTEWLEQHQELIEKYMNYFTAYPDLFIDLISREDDDVKLFFYQRIILRACMRYKEVYLVACVDGETPVLTEKGMVPIKDYELGTAVWTKDGWKYPINKNWHDYREEIVEISGTNSFCEDIRVTKDHQFLCWSKTNPVPHWVEAQDLNQEEYLITPIDMTIKDLDTFMGVKLDSDFYQLLGYFISNGVYHNGKLKIIGDEKICKKVYSLSQKVFHITPGLDYDEYFDCLNFENMLNQFFVDLYDDDLKGIFGQRRIPTRLLCAAPHKQLQLFKAWYQAAHYKDQNGKFKSNGCSLGIEGMKLILQRNRINPTINKFKNKPIYSLELPKKIHKKVVITQDELEFEDNIRTFADTVHQYDSMEFMLNKVKKVTLLPPGTQTVYCLEFEDGSFNINGVESHNCRATAKTFLSIMALFLQCMFVPNSRRFIVATFKTQAAKVAKEKIIEIYMHWPLLRKEIVGGDFDEQPGNFGWLQSCRSKTL